MNIQIKTRLAQRIYKLSKETKKDTAYHFNKAVEGYLEELKDLREAVRRMNNSRDKFITPAQLRKVLGL